jgi:hypothetical protein
MQAMQTMQGIRFNCLFVWIADQKAKLSFPFNSAAVVQNLIFVTFAG